MFEKIAYAASTPPSAEGSPIAIFFPFILMFVVMYFLIWRPQQKQRQQLKKLVDNLKKGDHIVTAGGLLGTITSIQKDYVVMRCGDNDQTKIEVLKSSITGARE